MNIWGINYFKMLQKYALFLHTEEKQIPMSYCDTQAKNLMTTLIQLI